jgi:ABC-type multidrug transport system ATPase subunit
LLGPNGAGKSTAIHMMAGLLRLDGGQVTINGAADPTGHTAHWLAGPEQHAGDPALVVED